MVDTPSLSAQDMGSVSAAHAPPNPPGYLPLRLNAIDTPPASVNTPSPTTIVSPTFDRKSSEKYDMRQTTTELPSAFVPLASQFTPQSATPALQPHRTFHAHSQPSISSIVFGRPEMEDSSNLSPVPPDSSFPPPIIPHQNSHEQHSYVQRSVPHGIVPPVAPWSSRQPYPHHHSHSSTSHQHFRYPPREVFTPNEPHQQNGHPSRSPSRASSAARQKGPEDLHSPTSAGVPPDGVRTMYREHKSAHSGAPPVRPFSYQAPPPPVQLPPHADMWNLQALRSHLESQFLNGSLSDIVVVQEDREGVRQYFEGHKVVLSRSPTLLELIKASDLPSSASLQTEVYIQLQDDRVRLDMFMDSLKFLYGGPLPQANPSRQAGFDSESMAVNNERMEAALSFIATGDWLKVPVIATRGVEVAMCLLNWDTVAAALAFALEGGLSSIWSQFDDSSDGRMSCSSSDDSSISSGGPPKYDPHATALLQRTIHFIVQMLPPNFYLDASAPQLRSSPRLPSLPLGHESRPSRSDPRLSKIRFGDVPVEDLQRPSFVTTTTSSILLSLPFLLLKCLLEHPDFAARLGPDTAASIMRQVVAERELRRIKIREARYGQADGHLIHNLHWEESVEPSAHHRAGSRLVRRKKGIETPPSSGTESSKS